MAALKKNAIAKGLFWKILERFGVSGTQFILQLVLARILDPSHYGTLSMMVVFTTLSKVFIQRGFNTALVQNNDVTDEDFSSVFWVSLSIACGLYTLLFISAPFIAQVYKMPEIVVPFRVLCLILLPGSLNSVQLAKINREMNFKKVFTSNVLGIVVAGIAGVTVALLGGGLWALVTQNLVNVITTCIVMRFTSKLKIRFVCNMQRVKVLFSFGWKLLVSSLIDTLYQDLRSLVVGLKYNSSTLGFYNRGKHFPQFVGNVINNSVSAVMLPAMSKTQDHPEKLKAMMRRSISLSAYMIFPMMSGLAAVATPLVTILLTEKWLPCVPFMQIYCFIYAFQPVHVCNLQAINAVGRSDVFLKLEVVKKMYGIAFLLGAVIFFDSPISIAMTGLITAWIGWFVNAYPNKKLVNYSYIELIHDVLPTFLLAISMFGFVLWIGTLNINVYLLLVIQILCGVVYYIGLSILFKFEPFEYLLKQITQFRKG